MERELTARRAFLDWILKGNFTNRTEEVLNEYLDIDAIQDILDSTPDDQLAETLSIIYSDLPEDPNLNEFLAYTNVIFLLKLGVNPVKLPPKLITDDILELAIEKGFKFCLDNPRMDISSLIKLIHGDLPIPLETFRKSLKTCSAKYNVLKPAFDNYNAVIDTQLKELSSQIVTLQNKITSLSNLSLALNEFIQQPVKQEIFKEFSMLPASNVFPGGQAFQETRSVTKVNTITAEYLKNLNMSTPYEEIEKIGQFLNLKLPLIKSEAIRVLHDYATLL